MTDDGSRPADQRKAGARVIPFPAAPASPTGRPSRVEVVPLRCALDWATMLCRPRVSAQIFKALVRLAKPGALRTLDLIGEDGTRLPVEVSTSADGDAYVIFRGNGVYVKVHNPRPKVQRSEGEGVRRYGVEAQIQGTALAASRYGVDVARWMRDAIFAALYADQGATYAERRENLRADTLPGRWDVAVDVAIRPRDPSDAFGADDWIEEDLFRAGSLRDAALRFVTRARSPRAVEQRRLNDRAHDNYSARQQGKESTGRTLYLGNALELCVYEKDKHRAVSSEIARATLQRECGWNGADRVIRWEVRATRDWFRDQQCDRVSPDGSRERVWSNDITFDDFLDNFARFSREVISRFRHVDIEPGKRRRDCPESAFYAAVTAGIGLYRDDGRSADAATIDRIVSTRREAALERSTSAAAGGAVRVLAIMGEAFTEQGIASALERVSQAIGERAEHFEALHRRTLLRHRQAEGLSVAELVA